MPTSPESEGVDVNDPEIQVVAGGILSPALAAEAAKHVAADDFANPKLRILWGALMQLLDSGAKPDEIDVVSVAARCAKTPEYRKKFALYAAQVLDGMPRWGSLVNIAQRVHRRATMRIALEEMRRVATYIKEQLDSNDGEAEDLPGELARLSVVVSARSDETTLRTIFRDLSGEVQAYFDQLMTGHMPGTIPTGLCALDRRLGGGLRKGQLHVVLGAPGSGKTAFASQLCDAAVDSGSRALMFSMEVDPVDVYVRDVERAAGRSRWDLRSRASITRDQALSRLVAAQSSMLTGGPGKVVFGEPISVEGIRQTVLTERLRGGPVGLVAVDHAQVALPSKSEKRGMPRYLEVKNTVEGLRALARNLNVAVLLTGQLNPPPKGERPTMFMARESKELTTVPEVVLLLWHETDDAGDGDIILKESWVIADKVRAGQRGKIRVRYDGQIFRFTDMPSAHGGVESPEARD